MYCKKCGGKVDNYASHCPFCGEPLNNNDMTSTYSKPVKDRKSGSTSKSFGKWIGISLLTLIPIVGFILSCVWAFSSKTKSDPTFRNWAKLELLVRLLVIVAGVTCLIIYWPETIEFFTVTLPAKFAK